VAGFAAVAMFSVAACERPSSGDAALNRPATSGTAPILLFVGTGTSPNDVLALTSLLESNHLAYATATSRQLNEMGESQLRAYQLLIIPGGNFIEMGASLDSTTTTSIHNAVLAGLNYLGVCAGGFLAGNSHGYYHSLDLTSGVRFEFYAISRQGVRKAPVPIATVGAPTQDQYWEDGPQFTGWGTVVAKYPDGTPAVVQGLSGAGWVVLTGVHPEAPEHWRRGMTFRTPASVDNAYAAMLVDAALHRTSLPHY